MKFCVNCDNMYYIGLNETDGNKLIYYCRNCGHKDLESAEEGSCVLKTNIQKNSLTFNHIINDYTKLDPTLPRIYNIKCPNDTCITNHESATSSETVSGGEKPPSETVSGGKKPPSEVIYMRYDDENMKYLYICVHCNTNWKTDERVD